MNKEILTFDKAILNLKKGKKRNFNETVEVHVNLNIDTSKSDQNISTFVVLPEHTKIYKKIVVITDKPKSDFKFPSPPYEFGGEHIIKDLIANKNFKFDYIITEPSMMKVLGKYGKQLGTKGLLPSPKKGTVSNDLQTLYNNLVSQQIGMKNDKDGVIHFTIGKLSLSDHDLTKNYEAAILQIKKSKKPTIKGDLIKSIFLTTTMGKSYRIF